MVGPLNCLSQLNRLPWTFNGVPEPPVPEAFMVGADVRNILQLPTEGGEHTLIQSKRLADGLLVLPVLQDITPVAIQAGGRGGLVYVLR